MYVRVPATSLMPLFQFRLGTALQAWEIIDFITHCTLRNRDLLQPAICFLFSYSRTSQKKTSVYETTWMVFNCCYIIISSRFYCYMLSHTQQGKCSHWAPETRAEYLHFFACASNAVGLTLDCMLTTPSFLQHMSLCPSAYATRK